VGDRVLGIVGLVTLGGTVVWAIVGGDAEPVGALLIIGLGLVVVDAVIWRFAARSLDVPDGVSLPSPPWGLSVGPAGAVGLVAAVILGVPLLAVVCAIAVVAALPGLYARFPADAVPLRVVGHARRVRRFAEAHGVSRDDPIPGYVTPVGEGGARFVVVAPDRAWAALMVNQDEAELVARLAQVELRDRTSPDVGRTLATGRRYWETMNQSW
jgi:hypothetical protein